MNELFNIYDIESFQAQTYTKEELVERYLDLLNVVCVLSTMNAIDIKEFMRIRNLITQFDRDIQHDIEVAKGNITLN